MGSVTLLQLIGQLRLVASERNITALLSGEVNVVVHLGQVLLADERSHGRARVLGVTHLERHPTHNAMVRTRLHMDTKASSSIRRHVTLIVFAASTNCWTNLS
jgi:hypothetical protein